ncbi:pyridoxal phosphate-dependent aminotransferase [Candidatus Uabimicrobium sp. HlEnr_7]|uniref:pyridoxal phosphate-dependent aminotransferase n=1 Tax=Candidatus Uabimicrobium helgolandensis TaxID=3095367 RepID=UPI003557D3AA
MELNRTLSKVTPSLTLQLVAKVSELKKEGKDIVGFTVGEPDFSTPEHIKQQGIEAIKDNFTRYTAAVGIIELKEAIVNKLQNDNGLTYLPENIAVNCGAKHSVSNVLMALINAGDEIIIPAPYWLSYPEMVTLCHGNSVIVPTTKESGYKMTAEQLKKAITPKTKAVIINSPNNPSGAVYSEKELESLVSVIAESGIWVISDEIYEKLIYDDNKHFSLAKYPQIKSQVIVVNGVSKAYAMTGWRIGYIAAQKEVIQAVAKIQSQFTSSPCSISQRAAIAAISGSQQEVEKMRGVFEERRNLACELLSKIPGLSVDKAPGAFYLFPQCDGYGKVTADGKAINNSLDLADYLLEKHHVVVVPGQAFGCDLNFRISYATSQEQIKKGIERIHQAFIELRQA